MNNKQRKQIQDAIDQNNRRRERSISRSFTSDDIKAMASPVDMSVLNARVSGVYRECKG